mmetsp:Transcript_30448/g.37478  ORF Transcript_30448/g.37478 Transcript_30448/m.37478 type:complete len:104 (+) Transcript_30448:846-1157(+)
MLSSSIATAFTLATMIALGLCGALMFGEYTETNFLINLKSHAGPASTMIRLSFCLVFMMHMPYAFFVAKECILVIYDEFTSRALSNKLEVKLADYLSKHLNRE